MISGDDQMLPTAVLLSEDKKTTVADKHGWEGKKYTAAPAAPADAGTYEAVVYSNVGDREPKGRSSMPSR